MRRTALALALCLATAAVQAHDDGHDISRVNGGIRTDAGQTYGDIETVNGGIDLARGTIAGDVSTVNGGIDVGEQVRVKSLETVNGGIDAGRDLQVSDDIDTVNGGIHLAPGTRVGDEVATVNGRIDLDHTTVGGQVHTVSGDVIVGEGSLVRGGLLVEKPHGMSWSWNKPTIPRIVIGPNAEVQGELRFEREVELFVHTTAKIGKVTGATPRSYTDRLPPRP